jgi:cyclohexanecarboxylate-CoA ligase
VTELDDLLTGTGARWVGADGQRMDADEAVERTSRTTTFVHLYSWPVTGSVSDLATFRWAWRQGTVASPFFDEPGDGILSPRLPPDAAVVLLTAGSSGTPKEVVHTHASLAHKTRQMVDLHGLTAEDTVLMPAPLSHMSGLLNGLLVPGAAGMTTVLMERWSAQLALDLIEQEQVTFMVGPPTYFLDLWRSPDFTSRRVASLRLVSCGGAGVTEAFVHDAEAQLGCVVKRTYGSTEAPTVATTPVDLHADPRRATTEGRATPGTELRVVDGELQVRGPELFAGYLDADQTAAAMTGDGWFRTGDRASIDDEGWLTILGRTSELIIRGGENIAPAAVEAVLEAHPAVAHAVVVGLPDERLGERVVAIVELVPDESFASEAFDGEEVRGWFAEQGAPRFTTPERVLVVESLPRLPSGKPDRQAARRLLTP